MDGGSTMADLRSVVVGDVVPGRWSGPARMLADGPPRWHALRVAPQSEPGVERWLDRHGIHGLHPVIRITRRRADGRSVSRSRAWLPGYVFAWFPAAPRPHALRAGCADLLGAIPAPDGGWAVLDPADLRAVLNLCDRDRCAQLARARARAEARDRALAARALRPGGAVLFRDGPLAARTARLVELRGCDGAVVALRLFGAEVLVQARAQDLVGLAGGARHG